jgi:NAD(P)-dependent dehydrogenase (short-subunit alcohol dehydrogenase family)
MSAVPSSRLEGRVAVVTGAGGAIGRATALRLATEGASVVAADIRSEPAAETAALVLDLGGEAASVAIDVSDEGDVARLVDTVMDRFSRLDIYHNNAALMSAEYPDGDLLDLDVSVWDAKMAVNVRGVMLGCKHAVRAMRSSGDGGSIVNMSSVSALVGVDQNAAYGSSKAAVIGLTRYVATMYGHDGIRCNAIAPGLVLSEALESRLSPRQVREYAAERLLPWPAAPEDIAATVAFLASDEARCITGQTVVVDSGTTAHRPRHSMRAWERSLKDLGEVGDLA